MRTSEHPENSNYSEDNLDSLSMSPGPKNPPPITQPIKPRLMRALPANMAKVIGSFDDFVSDGLSHNL
jgi:hypothetical protein